MKTILFLQGRGPDKLTSACDNPNPPPWCDEQIETAGAIDQYIYYTFSLLQLLLECILYGRLKNKQN